MIQSTVHILYQNGKIKINPYLADIPLHHTNGVRQDVAGQPLDLLAEGGAEQESCLRGTAD